MALPQSVIDQLNLTSASSLPNNVDAGGVQIAQPVSLQPQVQVAAQQVQPVATVDPTQAQFAQPAPVSFTPQDAASLQQIQGPVIARLPSTTAALQTKYSSGAYDGLPADVLSALKQTDIARANRGVYPLSHADTLAAAQAAATKKPTTAAKKLNPWDVPGNALADLVGIAESVPRIPAGLINEAHRITQLPEEIGKVHSVKQFTQLPGIDLIPGAHTIGDISQGTQGLRDLATHPLQTAFDVLPGAKELAETTDVAKLANETAEANIAAGQSPLENRVNPLTTILTKKVVEGAEGPELANRALGNAADLIRQTRAGQAWAAAFSPGARVDSQLIRRGDAEAAFQAHDAGGDAVSQVSAASLPLAEPSGRTLYNTYGMTKGEAAQVTQAMQLDPASIANMPANHQQYVADYQQRLGQLQQWQVENNFLTERDGELYNPQDAATIDRRKSLFEKAHVKTDAAYTNLIGKYVAPVGVSAPQWRDIVDASTVQGGGVDGVLNHSNIPTRPIPNELMPLHDAYQNYLNGTGTAADLKKIVNNLNLGRTSIGATSTVLKSGAKAEEAAAPVTTLAEFGNFKKSVDRLASAEKVAQRTVVPARFMPALSDAAQRQYIAYKLTDPADIEQATQLAHDGMLQQMEGYSRKTTYDPVTGIRTKGLLDFFDEIAPTWQSMKDEGFDPVYVHSVSPEAAAGTFFPKVTEIPRTPSALKNRTLDVTPTYRDANLSLAANAVDFIKQRVSQSVVDNLANLRAVPKDQVLAEFDHQATAESLRDPSSPKSAHLQRLINQKYEAYDPDTLFNTDRFTASSSPDLYIPKVDAKVIRDSFTPKTYKLTSALDPLTGVMRTSLLPLSPRWNLYNIVGGAITGQAISSPGFLTRAPQAWSMVGKLMRGEDISDVLPHELLNSLGGTKRDELEMQFRAGRTLRRMRDEVLGKDQDLDAAAAQGETAGIPQTGPVSALKSGFDKVVQTSFDVNQRFDDMYRIMGYLDGYDTSGAIKGMTEEGRIQFGLTQANQVLQDMTQLTPFELNVLRPIFPFYTYYQHILRYAMKYPMDHPLRTSITSAIARQQINQLGGLPTQFLNVFTWGKPDAHGNQQGINTQSLNPFADVSGLFTLAGWIGATNPAIKTLADMAGIDTDNGGPELYPTLGYDPTTGKLTNSSPNPLESLLFNTIPQTQIIGNLVGQNSEFKQLLKSDPAAASALLRTEGGLPLVLRQYNLDKSRISAELNRQKAAATAKTADLKSGDIGDLANYPSLAPVLQRLAQLQQSGQLARYQAAPTPTPSTGSIALQSLTGTVGFNSLPPSTQGAYADQLDAMQQSKNRTDIP